MRKIPIEQPPGASPALAEWLTRMMTMMNASLDQTPVYEPVGSLPTKMEEGRVTFFNQAIAPDITHAGPWIVVDGVWRSMI